MSAYEEIVKPEKSSSWPGPPVDEQTELTDKNIVEEDARPFFFRYATAVVKFCAVFLIAGQQVAYVMCLLFAVVSILQQTLHSLIAVYVML